MRLWFLSRSSFIMVKQIVKYSVFYKKNIRNSMIGHVLLKVEISKIIFSNKVYKIFLVNWFFMNWVTVIPDAVTGTDWSDSESWRDALPELILNKNNYEIYRGLSDGSRIIRCRLNIEFNCRFPKSYPYR